MDWYYAKGGAQQGPVSIEELRQRLASGEVAQSDLVWHEGMADWAPAGEMAELRQGGAAAENLAPRATTGPAAGFPQRAVPVAPLAGAAAVVPGRQQGLALASMICGIVALLGLCFSLGLPVGIAAVVLGHVAKSKIRRNPQVHGGRGMATAGLVMGYLAAVLGAVLLVFSIWLVTADPSKLEFLPPEMRQQLQEQRALRQGHGTPPAPDAGQSGR